MLSEGIIKKGGSYYPKNLKGVGNPPISLHWKEKLEKVADDERRRRIRKNGIKNYY